MIRRLPIAAVALALLGTAAGCGGSGESTASAGETGAATAAYRSYLLESADKLTTWTAQLRNKFKLQILGGAQSRYASSLVPLGHLLAALALFPNLSKQLVDPATGAFPRIERLLWKEQETGRRGAVEAGRAREAALQLHEQVKTVSLPPTRLLADAEGTLREISNVDLRLRASPFAHLDLIPASANLEGVEAVYGALKPMAEAADPDLAQEISHGFKGAFTELEKFGPPAHNLDQVRPSSPGTAFIATGNGQVKPADLQPISEHVAELHTLFEELSSHLE